jgi:RNA polymerase sigma-70 factor (ECF subfamily)
MDDRIRHHRAELLGWLSRRAPQDAEELAQEVWLRVARAAPDCPDEASFRGYAFAVARRLLVDQHRRRAARVVLVSLDGGAPDTDDPGARPDGGLAAAQILAVVEAELARMKPEIAQVFRWRTAEDLPFKEIAARQGVGLNTALGRMHQAVGALRAALHQAGLLGASP